MATATQASAPEKTQAKISYEEFLEQMDEDRHVEWVDGEITAISPISNVHQKLGAYLLTLLQVYADARQLGEVRYEPFQMKPAANLPGRSPDILFVAEAHRVRLKKNFLEGPADLVVEIISPESRARDRGDKFFEYEAAGIPEYWLLDPIREQAEWYQLGTNGIYRPAALDEQGRYHSVVLPGLWLQVDWIWQTPLPPLLSVLKAWELI